MSSIMPVIYVPLIFLDRAYIMRSKHSRKDTMPPTLNMKLPIVIKNNNFFKSFF